MMIKFVVWDLATICKLAWSMVFYNIWLQENALVCSGNVKFEEAILLLIRREIKAYVEFVMRMKNLMNNLML